MAKTKLDLYKQYKSEYAAKSEPALVKIGKVKYLAIDGTGAPGGDIFTASIGALYGMAFTIKMTRKFAGRQDYAVTKLEAQWWCDGQMDFATVPKESWNWKLLIRTPDFITTKDLENALAILRKRGKGAGAEQVHLEILTEGQCVQMLHIGPYENECNSVALMKAFAESKKASLRGPHHEIYLSDPRRVEPARLKTILRIPLKAE